VLTGKVPILAALAADMGLSPSSSCDRDGNEIHARGLLLDMAPWPVGVYSWKRII